MKMKIVYINMIQKCFGNSLEPFEGVPATAGLELVVTGVEWHRDIFEGS
jgi:hypothetical protein